MGDNKTLDQKIDSLTTLVEEGFRATQEQFVAIDERFSRIDQRFDGIEKTLKNQYPDKDYLDQKFTTFGEELTRRLDARFEKEEKFRKELFYTLKTHRILPPEALQALERYL